MNSNPETVSIDYYTSDILYFEPLTVKDVLKIERSDGIILAIPIQYLDEQKLVTAGGLGLVRIWGTSPDSIDAAEDRGRFNAIVKDLKIEQSKGGLPRVICCSAFICAGGRVMEIVYSDEKLVTYLETAVQVDLECPVLIDRYLSDAIEIGVDALAHSYGNVVMGAIMEHIEQAGVQCGDSACSLPTKTVPSCLDKIRTWTTKLAKSLIVCGLMNYQYAITPSGDLYLLEVNPHASRTVPFVSKAIGHPLAKYASLVMSGKSLYDLEFTRHKFQGCDVLLCPEMRSTGEVMGIDYEAPVAFAKAQIATGQRYLFLATIARAFISLSIRILSTSGTAQMLELEGLPVERVLKMQEGQPHAGDMLSKVPIIATVAGALATADPIRRMKLNGVR
ncbi:hypothetical protein AQUCO_07600030v1 [Aquilegia coerulea]|uniref:carbamoyl-phosphate synthase (ammonia) n=1 Tax=Aquilegia coerulea TaxID=218851 RepID=A0A2G5C9Q8_AQUCA|nr:hypothetical protein AQUCO_07600030v1 [Aquilegia coerulea]